MQKNYISLSTVLKSIAESMRHVKPFKDHRKNFDSVKFVDFSMLGIRGDALLELIESCEKEYQITISSALLSSVKTPAQLASIVFALTNQHITENL
jgi:hypothetical protein